MEIYRNIGIYAIERSWLIQILPKWWQYMWFVSFSFYSTLTCFDYFLYYISRKCFPSVVSYSLLFIIYYIRNIVHLVSTTFMFSTFLFATFLLATYLFSIFLLATLLFATFLFSTFLFTTFLLETHFYLPHFCLPRLYLPLFCFAAFSLPHFVCHGVR